MDPIVPVSTIGISLDSGLFNDGHNFRHIQEVPFFQTYTIDELRYYDYLKNGYISIVEPDRFQSFHQQNQFQLYSSDICNNFQDDEQDTVYHEMSPWSFGFSSLQDPESMPQTQQTQPYGAFPDTHINLQDQENLSDQQNDLFDDDFDHPQSIFIQYTKMRNPFKKY